MKRLFEWIIIFCLFIPLAFADLPDPPSSNPHCNDPSYAENNQNECCYGLDCTQITPSPALCMNWVVCNQNSKLCGEYANNPTGCDDHIGIPADCNKADCEPGQFNEGVCVAKPDPSKNGQRCYYSNPDEGKCCDGECQSDMDKDGFTTINPPSSNCGFGGDCNDNNPHIHPGIAEVCDDGIDTNCNGKEDRFEAVCKDKACKPSNLLASPDFADNCDIGIWTGDPNSDSGMYCCQDCDTVCIGGSCLNLGDGHIVDGCSEAGKNYGTKKGGDCQDSDALINPSATELCYDYTDNDCNLKTDCSDPVCGGQICDITPDPILGTVTGQKKCCSGECADMMSDFSNCGGCGITCNPIEVCERGTCGCAITPISQNPHFPITQDQLMNHILPPFIKGLISSNPGNPSNTKWSIKFYIDKTWGPASPAYYRANVCLMF